MSHKWTLYDQPINHPLIGKDLDLTTHGRNGPKSVFEHLIPQKLSKNQFYHYLYLGTGNY